MKVLPLIVRTLVFTVAFLTVLVYILLIVWPYGLEYYVAQLGSEPVDFYKAGGVEVSLDDITKVVEEAGRTIYLPSKFPHGL
ncbi:MAG: hypothetical protein QXI36_00070 [Candidatus Bathyarchaeia archaeon]